MTDVSTEKKDSKSKLLTAAVIVILCLIFVVGFIFGLNSVLAMEGAFPPNRLTQAAVFLPDTVQSTHEEIAAFTKNDMAEYLSGLVDDVLTNEASSSSSRSYSIDSDTIETSGSDKFLDTVKFIADDIDSSDTQLGRAMFSDFEGGSTAFGEDMSGLLRVPDIRPEDIESFDISYIYYICPVCGDSSDEPLDSCEDCGSTYPYNMAYRNDYDITLHLVNSADVFSRNFRERTNEELIAVLEEEMAEKLSFEELERECRELAVSFTVERETNHIKSLRYTYKLYAGVTAVFEGELEKLGTQKTTFELSRTDGFGFTWPGIELDEHEMELEPKGTDNLIATLTCAEPTKMTVIWDSSDSSIVDVDDEGYLKACKTDGGKAVITATYEFNGRVYSDSCEVTVKYPVESTSMKKNKVTLAPGEEFKLTVKFDPKNATFQTLTWHTEDDSIATVDENGVVKAVAAGETTVYSLSDDGYFKSSCKITVK